MASALCLASLYVCSLCIASQVRALSPAFVQEEFSLQFAKGAIALRPEERERLASDINRLLLKERLCTRSFLVVGFGDPGLSAYENRLLALERAKYVKNLATRLHLGTPDINIGEDAPKGTEFLGSVRISFFSYLKPLGC